MLMIMYIQNCEVPGSRRALDSSIVILLVSSENEVASIGSVKSSTKSNRVRQGGTFWISMDRGR